MKKIFCILFLLGGQMLPSELILGSFRNLSSATFLVRDGQSRPLTTVKPTDVNAHKTMLSTYQKLNRETGQLFISDQKGVLLWKFNYVGTKQIDCDVVQCTWNFTLINVVGQDQKQITHTEVKKGFEDCHWVHFALDEEGVTLSFEVVSIPKRKM